MPTTAPIPTRSDAPAGTVALVFTDIEGSTRLWDVMGADFQPVLALHDACLRAALAEHHGYEVKTEGDAFFAAFDTAAQALDFCLAAQQRLERAAWPAALVQHPEAAPCPRCTGSVYGWASTSARPSAPATH